MSVKATAGETAATERLVTLDVAVLGRDYKVSCKESERSELLDVVAYLDRLMHEIRDAGKVASTERIAVMAALNIAHDLQRARVELRAVSKPDPALRPAIGAIDGSDARRRIAIMLSAIEQALVSGEAHS